MKSGPSAEMYGSEAHRLADLFTLYLAAGTQRWTSADMAITYGGNTWTPAPVVSNVRARSVLRLEVDACDLDLTPGELAVGGVSVLARALRGDLYGVRVVVERAWVTAAGVVAGLEPVFDGSVVEVRPSSTQVRLAVKSLAYRLASQEIPSRRIQPGCPYQVGDASCGVSLASWTTTTTVAAGSTADTVNLVASTTNANVVGWLEFTSGALAGVRAAIVEVLSSTQVRVAVPLSSAPAVGDGVKVVKGCTKDRTGCDAFSNTVRFGGFPSVPQAEAT